MTLDLERSLSTLSHADDHDPGTDTIRARAETRRQRRSRRLATAGVVGLVLVVLAAVAAVRLGDDGSETHDTPRLPAVRVERLRVAGTGGLDLTTSGDFGFSVDAIRPIRLPNGAEQLVAPTAHAADPTARWSDDDGHTWRPIELPAGARPNVDKTAVRVIDDHLIITSGPDRLAGFGRLPQIWTTTDASQPLEAATLVGAPLDGDAVIEITGAAPARVRGDLVLFGRAGDDRHLRIASADGRRWQVEDVTFDSVPEAARPISIERVGQVGDRLVEIAGPLPLGSDDGGRTWTEVDVPGFDPDLMFGTGNVRTVDGQHFLSDGAGLWSSVDGHTWTPLLRGPVPLPEHGHVGYPGIVVLAADGDHLVARIGTQFGEDSFRADLGWSDDGGATWHQASQPPCPYDDLGDVAGSVTDAVRLGDDSLLVTWTCKRQTQVLRSADDGRTWTPVTGTATAGRRSAPHRLDDGSAVVIGVAEENRLDGPYLRIVPEP